MAKRKLSEIYREAAELLGSLKQDFSCCAIMDASDPSGDLESSEIEAVGVYLKMFSPEYKSTNIDKRMDSLQDHYPLYFTSEGRNHRILALLFMAAICESEGN
jgi:hypothetical protein